MAQGTEQRQIGNPPNDRGHSRLTLLSLWIVVSFLGGILYLLFGIGALLGLLGLEISVRVFGDVIIGIGSFFLIMMDVGLLQRRRSGLTMSYVLLGFVTLGSLMSVARDFKNPGVSDAALGIKTLTYFLAIGLACLWWLYFMRRQHWFRGARDCDSERDARELAKHREEHGVPSISEPLV